MDKKETGASTKRPDKKRKRGKGESTPAKKRGKEEKKEKKPRRKKNKAEPTIVAVPASPSITRAAAHAEFHGCCPIGHLSLGPPAVQQALELEPVADLQTASQGDASLHADEDVAMEEEQRDESIMARIQILQLTLIHEDDQRQIRELQQRPIMMDRSTQMDEEVKAASTVPVVYFHPGPVLIPGIYSCCHASMHASTPGCTAQVNRH
jgi:hypothetical protein